MKLINQNFNIGLIFSVFAAVIYFQISELPPNVAIFPKICSVIIILTGITALIKSFYQRSEADRKTIFNRQLSVVIVSLIATYGFMLFIGFYTASFLFVYYMFLYTDAEWKRPSFLKGGIFSSVTTVILYILFSVFMKLATPEGILI